MSRDKITARTLLSMTPADVPLAVQRLGEANRYLLANAATRLVLSMGKDISKADAEAYGLMFESLGPARLKAHILTQLMGAADTPDGRAVVLATHPWVSRAIVTGVFGVPIGEAGHGCAPQLGVSDNDKFDMFVLQEQPQLLGKFYDHMVAVAMMQGTVLVDELPPQKG